MSGGGCSERARRSVPFPAARRSFARSRRSDSPDARPRSGRRPSSVSRRRPLGLTADQTPPTIRHGRCGCRCDSESASVVQRHHRRDRGVGTTSAHRPSSVAAQPTQPAVRIVERQQQRMRDAVAPPHVRGRREEMGAGEPQALSPAGDRTQVAPETSPGSSLAGQRPGPAARYRGRGYRHSERSTVTCPRGQGRRDARWSSDYAAPGRTRDGRHRWP